MEQTEIITVYNTVQKATTELDMLQAEIASVKTHIEGLATRIKCLSEYLAVHGGMPEEEPQPTPEPNESPTSFYKRTRSKRKNYE